MIARSLLQLFRLDLHLHRGPRDSQQRLDEVGNIPPSIGDRGGISEPGSPEPRARNGQIPGACWPQPRADAVSVSWVRRGRQARGFSWVLTAITLVCIGTSCKRTPASHYDFRFSEGMAPFVDGKRWGYIDRSGNVVVPATWGHAAVFSDGLAGVSQDGQMRYIDHGGNVVFLLPAHLRSRGFREGMAVVFHPRAHRLSRYGVIDALGRLVVPPSYPMIGNFSERMAVVETPSGLWGYIDVTGDLVIPATFDRAGSFGEGRAFVKEGSEKYFIDTLGSKVARLPDEADWVQPLSEGMALFRIPWRWGYVNREGDVVIPPVYEFAEAFSEGHAAVMVDGKWGYVDRTGTMAIPPRFREAGSFNEGLAAVRKGRRWGYIDAEGTIAIPCRFEYAFGFSQQRAAVMVRGRIGYIDSRGDWIFKPRPFARRIDILD